MVNNFILITLLIISIILVLFPLLIICSVICVEERTEKLLENFYDAVDDTILWIEQYTIAFFTEFIDSILERWNEISGTLTNLWYDTVGEIENNWIEFSDSVKKNWNEFIIGVRYRPT